MPDVDRRDGCARAGGVQRVSAHDAVAGVALVHQFRHVEHALSGHAVSGDDANVLPGRFVRPVRPARHGGIRGVLGRQGLGFVSAKGICKYALGGRRRVGPHPGGRREVRVGHRPAHAHRRRGAAELRHRQCQRSLVGHPVHRAQPRGGHRHSQIQLVAGRCAPIGGSGQFAALRDSQFRLRHLPARAKCGRGNPHHAVADEARCSGHAQSPCVEPSGFRRFFYCRTRV